MPGDTVVADDDGVVVVGRRMPPTWSPRARSASPTKTASASSLASGELGLDMYRMREPLAKAGLVYVDNPGGGLRVAMRLRTLLGDHPGTSGAEERLDPVRSGRVRFRRSIRRPTRASSRWSAKAAFDVSRDGDRHLSDGEVVRQADGAAAGRHAGAVPAWPCAVQCEGGNARAARPRTASASASARSRRRPAPGCAASSPTTTASISTRSTG